MAKVTDAVRKAAEELKKAREAKQPCAPGLSRQFKEMAGKIKTIRAQLEAERRRIAEQEQLAIKQVQIDFAKRKRALDDDCIEGERAAAAAVGVPTPGVAKKTAKKAGKKVAKAAGGKKVAKAAGGKKRAKAAAPLEAESKARFDQAYAQARKESAADLAEARKAKKAGKKAAKKAPMVATPGVKVQIDPNDLRKGIRIEMKDPTVSESAAREIARSKLEVNCHAYDGMKAPRGRLPARQAAGGAPAKKASKKAGKKAAKKAGGKKASKKTGGEAAAKPAKKTTAKKAGKKAAKVTTAVKQETAAPAEKPAETAEVKKPPKRGPKGKAQGGGELSPEQQAAFANNIQANIAASLAALRKPAVPAPAAAESMYRRRSFRR